MARALQQLAGLTMWERRNSKEDDEKEVVKWEEEGWKQKLSSEGVSLKGRCGGRLQLFPLELKGSAAAAARVCHPKS